MKIESIYQKVAMAVVGEIFNIATDNIIVSRYMIDAEAKVSSDPLFDPSFLVTWVSWERIKLRKA